jgi:hypothetical protein
LKQHLGFHFHQGQQDKLKSVQHNKLIMECEICKQEFDPGNLVSVMAHMHDEEINPALAIGIKGKKIMEYYRQCRFRRNIREVNEKAYKETIAWIPEWAAVKGNAVQLLSLDEAFWNVIEVSEKRLTKDEMNERGYKDFQESLKGGGIDQ